jgi:hypothetical protein
METNMKLLTKSIHEQFWRNSRTRLTLAIEGRD